MFFLEFDSLGIGIFFRKSPSMKPNISKEPIPARAKKRLCVKTSPSNIPQNIPNPTHELLDLRWDATLPISEPYFSAIGAGTKDIEYRANTPYWTVRLVNPEKPIRYILLVNGRVPIKSPRILVEVREINVIPVSEIKDGLAPKAGTTEHKGIFRGLDTCIEIHIHRIIKRFLPGELVPTEASFFLERLAKTLKP